VTTAQAIAETSHSSSSRPIISSNP
jgi:hypothetical protein